MAEVPVARLNCVVLVSLVWSASHTPSVMNVCFIPPVCELTVPESPSAVLALVPDPAGGTHTVAGGRVALAVHTRFVAFLRLGEAGQPGEQHGDGEQQRWCQHQQAPAAARARAGPPCRPVHSLTKDGCYEAQAPLLRQRLGELAVDEAVFGGQRCDSPVADVQCLRSESCWLGPRFTSSRGPGSQRRTEPHIDNQK